MARGTDPADRRARRVEGDRDATTADRPGAPPRPELRWVQIGEPLQPVEIGANGRILASHYHPKYDAWEVLLETYEGDPSDGTQTR